LHDADQTKKRLAVTDWMKEELSLDAALDALVQLDANSPLDLISAIYQKRSAPALILLTKLGPKADPFLLELAGREKGIYWFAATNMLLAHRTPGTAALLLHNLEITAEIVISDDGVYIGSIETVTGSSGDMFPLSAPGYPPMVCYSLTPAALAGSIVLATGPETVYYARWLKRFGSTPTGPQQSIGGPTSEDRLRYIAALIGDSQELPLRATEGRSHKWRSQSALDSEISDLKQDILRRHSKLVQMLVDEKLLTADEAKAAPKPSIKVQVHALSSKPKK
jgi:hypothetical protein